MALRILSQAGPRKYLVPDLLTHSGGTITATFGLKTYQTVLSGLLQATRYQLYLLPNGTMVFSTRENSLGPIGATSWMLVGSFTADGNTSTAFGAFIPLEGKPGHDWVGFNPQISGFTVGNGGFANRYKRDGDTASILNVYEAGSTSTHTGNFVYRIPTNLFADVQKMPAAGGNSNPSLGMAGYVLDASTNNRLLIQSYLQNDSIILHSSANTPANVGHLQPFTFAVGDVVTMQSHIAITGWSNTPIKDL